ncbi:MAG: hypothetical protein R3C25_10580 [Hyphomonadaceae bacterium]
MPVARAISWIAAGVLAVVLGGCAGAARSIEEAGRMPREIRMREADMLIERVGADVDRAEVLATVQSLVAGAPLCQSWPGLWYDGEDRRGLFVVRYDLMSRDWGFDVSRDSQQRMNDFVEMGFLTARSRSDLGEGAVEYTVTPQGAAALQGSPYGGAPPAFCAGSQRRVIELTDMQWGDFPCGSLHVRFTHVADTWPNWARTQSAQERVLAAWGPIGAVADGEVTLGRQWFAPRRVPSGVVNGSLRSVCLDETRENVIGDDLALSPPAP